MPSGWGKLIAAAQVMGDRNYVDIGVGIIPW